MLKLPHVDCSRGAPMGRTVAHLAEHRLQPIRIALERVPLHEGYDSGGAYWGSPDNLYQASSKDYAVEFYVRGASRAEAETEVKLEYPNATFLEPELDPFTEAYMTCALWADLRDEEGGPLDEYSILDIDDALAAQMAEDCKDFQQAQADLLSAAYRVPGRDYNPSHAGHDFWLTRNSHGAGFWDRGLGDVGADLTNAAKVYGGRDLFLDTDGKIKGGM